MDAREQVLTDALSGVKGGLKMYGDATDLLSPEKLASQGSTYVMAVMLLVTFYALRTMWNKYCSDSKEQQSSFITAQKEMEKMRTESTREFIVALNEVRESIRNCRTQGAVEEARHGKRSLPMGG